MSLEREYSKNGEGADAMLDHGRGTILGLILIIRRC